MSTLNGSTGARRTPGRVAVVSVLALAFALQGCATQQARPAGCKPLNGGTDATQATVIGGVIGAVAGAAIGGSAAKKGAVGRRNGALFGALAGALAGNAYAKATEQPDGSVKLNMPGNVLFPTGSATLGGEVKPTLDTVASTIKEYCGVTAHVVGHTDNTGSYQVNQPLSQRRAQSVMAYLESQGVEASRLSSEGVADSQPVASNEDAAGRQQNRRVEVLVKPPAP